MSEEQNPTAGLTSAEIKKQIEQATRESKVKTDFKESGLPLTGMIASEINATQNSTPEKSPAPESKPDHLPANGSAAEKTTESVDLQEWARKRGVNWTTEESVLSALRKSDQAFHEKRQKEKKAAVDTGRDSGSGYTQPVYAPPPPAYIPPPQNGYQQPAYQPVNNRSVVEHIARQYNMLPEDVERLAAFNRDFFEAAARTEREKTQRELESIRLENQKNSVFRELSSDPVFRRPEVAVEYHRVLDDMQGSDPQSFEQDPNAYRRAFDMTLQNIARRNLEGQPLQEGIPPTSIPVTPPMTPPRQLGNGSGGGSYESENGIDPKQFAKLSSKDQRAVLDKMGLVKPAY